MSTEYTTEDQLITDLIDYWTTSTSLGAFTAAPSTDRLTTGAAHGLAVGARVRIEAGSGALPTGLVAEADYYVQSVPSATTLTLSATLGGSVINITAAGGNDNLLKTTVTSITGVSNSTPVRHYRDQSVCPVPAIIIGHDGVEREKAKGMTGTGRVSLRVALRSDMDVMDSETHRAQSAAIDRALQGMATKPGPLEYTYIHALLREGSQTVVNDRREITGLSYLAIVTRCN